MVVAPFYPLYEFASRIGGDKAEVSSLVPAGVEPHNWEPTPQDRLKVQSADMLVVNGAGFIEIAKNLDIDVIYSEDLVDSRLADTISGEIPGGKVMVLSPVEGISQKEQDTGVGYIDKMREDVRNLKVGLECR